MKSYATHKASKRRNKVNAWYFASTMMNSYTNNCANIIRKNALFMWVTDKNVASFFWIAQFLRF